MSKLIPFHKDGYVFFELRQPKLLVFEPGNDAGVYHIPNLRPGLQCLPVSALALPTAAQRRSHPERLISVDSAQMFFLDATTLPRFNRLFKPTLGSWPNYAYFNKLRKELGSAFGFLVAGAEESDVFDGDGTYVVDARRITPADLASPPRSVSADLYLRVARSMHTFVCVQCFNEELICESTPARDVAIAKAAGWIVTNERSEFGGFSVYGPKCAGKKNRGA